MRKTPTTNCSLARPRQVDANRLWPATASRALLVAALSLCMAGFGLAQNTNSGDIRGTVTDATGAVIPGATVTLLNIDTGVTNELVRNSVGLYDAVSILPGHSLASKLAV